MQSDQPHAVPIVGFPGRAMPAPTERREEDIAPCNAPRQRRSQQGERATARRERVEPPVRYPRFPAKRKVFKENHNGDPAKRKFRGERRSDGVNETCRLRRGERYEVCSDEPPEAEQGND